MLKLLTLNIYHDRNRWDDRFPLIVDVLRAEQPDVIALQEVHLHLRQADRIAEQLNAAAPDHPYSVHVAPKWGDSVWEGVAILSRLPVQDSERLELPIVERVALRVRVPFGGNDRHLNIVCTHLHHWPVDDEEARLPQMRALLDWMFARADGPWLLAGDLNAKPESSTIQLASERLHSAYHALHGEHPVTWPTPLVADDWPGVAVTIDYVFCSPQTLTVIDARRIADQPHPADPALYPSDHYGLSVTVDLT
jgi:endonuclease/exonuclease/phosphatase family metal-dependent hydrolase